MSTRLANKATVSSITSANNFVVTEDAGDTVRNFTYAGFVTFISTLDAASVGGTTPTTFGKSLIDDANAAAARTTLGIDTDDAVTFGALTCTSLVATTTVTADSAELNNIGNDTIPLIIRTNGSPGNFTPANSGIFLYDAAGNEIIRIFGSDTTDTNFNSANLYIGHEAGEDNLTNNTTAGRHNTGVGWEALYDNTTGSDNSGFGFDTLWLNTTGEGNTAIGFQAMYLGLANVNCTAVGKWALGNANDGVPPADKAVAIGYHTLYHGGGLGCTAVGSHAGSDNVVAAKDIVTDAKMTLIGYLATKNNAATLTNGTAIGAEAEVLLSNQVVIGNANVLSTILRGTVEIIHGNEALAGEIQLHEPTSSGTNYIALKSPNPMSANVTWTLPAALGSAGQQLTDAAGDGTLSWAAAASLREAKNILHEVSDQAESVLEKLIGVGVYDFTYKPGAGTGDCTTVYRGVMADELPDVMHFGGTIFNPVSAFGELLLALKGLAARVQKLEETFR